MSRCLVRRSTLRRLPRTSRRWKRERDFEPLDRTETPPRKEARLLHGRLRLRVPYEEERKSKSVSTSRSVRNKRREEIKCSPKHPPQHIVKPMERNPPPLVFLSSMISLLFPPLRILCEKPVDFLLTSENGLLTVEDLGEVASWRSNGRR